MDERIFCTLVKSFISILEGVNLNISLLGRSNESLKLLSMSYSFSIFKTGSTKPVIFVSSF